MTANSGATGENAIKTIRDRGFDMKNLQVSSPCYAFVDDRLFYRTSLPDSRTPSSPQTFADPSFPPPVLDIDLDRLAAIAKASGRIKFPASDWRSSVRGARGSYGRSFN
jgi:hypothetical protein